MLTRFDGDLGVGLVTRVVGGVTARAGGVSLTVDLSVVLVFLSLGFAFLSSVLLAIGIFSCWAVIGLFRDRLAVMNQT